MRILNEQEKRDLLHKILIELSESQDTLKDSRNRSEYFRRLESIYYNAGSDNFRHYYSDIFSSLTIIDADPAVGNLDILGQNIIAIKEGYKPINKDDNGKLIDISKEIIKLYDHINLDISRINYTKGITADTLSKINATSYSITKSLQNQLSEATKQLNNETNKLKEEVSEGQKKMQSEYITILGIFAAIVLAFTGGMAFSGSVLENIDKASSYRILSIAIILGMILLNLIWLLIDFLRDINGKSIRKWWIIVLIDTILTACLCALFVAYKLHWF